MTTHSIFSASGSHRWLNCPGSIALSKKAPKPKESVFAAEGTAAHELAEKALLNDVSPFEYVGQVIKDFEITSEMAGHVQVYVDAIEKVIDLCGLPDVYIEKKVNLKSIHSSMYGTADCVIYDYLHDELYVIDLKYGAGVPVEVTDNPQLAYYGIAAAETMEIEPKRIVNMIVQPRCEHKDGPIREASLYPEDIFFWKDRFTKGVQEAKKRNAKLASGDWCRWCPAAGMCDEFARAAQLAAKKDFLQVEKPRFRPPQELSLLTIGQILERADLVEKWIKSVREFAHLTAEQGTEIPGFKLVKKRANRKWSNEKEVIEFIKEKYGEDELAEVMTAPKLKSVAQTQKVKSVDFAELENFVIISDTGTSLVPEKDKRPAVLAGPKHEFEKIEN